MGGDGDGDLEKGNWVVPIAPKQLKDTGV